MKRALASIWTAVFLFAAAPALAAVSPYLGIGVGMNTFDTNIGPGSGTSLDDSDSGVRFTAGVSFNDVAALEVSRVDLGEGSLRGTTGGVFTQDGTPYVFLADGEVREELSTWAYGLVLSLPVNRLNGSEDRDVFVPFVRAGFNSWDLDASASFLGYTVTDSDSGTNPWFGLGCEVRMNRHAGMRVAYDWFVVNSEAVDKVRSLDLELLFRF